VRGELIEQSPKSHKSRDVPLIDALRPYAEAAARGKRGSDLLFDGPDGGRLTNHNARRAVNWDELREAIGRPDLRIHDLRHTFATILFDAGATAPDVQATLGHSSLQVTERYSRAREGVAIRTGAALNDALKRADESTDASRAKTGTKSQTKSADPEPEMAQRRTRRTLYGTLMAQPHERPRGMSL
jgi:integrase